MVPPTSRNVPYQSGHSVPLLPTPQGYPPPPGVQGPSVHHGGGQGVQSGGQKFVSAHQSQQQVNLGDLSAGMMSLVDLAPRVRALGFPASCSFVLGLLER